MVKGRVEGRVERRDIPAGDALVDLVRTRLHQGHARDDVPRQLSLLHGIDEEDVRRALAVVADEERGAQVRDRAEVARAAAWAAGVGAAAAGIVAVFGAAGATILSAFVSAAAMTVVVVEVRRRARR
jgi:hypothetical protein